MRTEEGRARPVGKVWAAVAAVLLVSAGSVHLWQNTNVLAEDRLCGGLVSTEQADAVLPGLGRLAAEGDGVDADLTDTVCRIERSSFVPGAGGGLLTARVYAQRGDEILGSAGASDPLNTSFFSGPVTGGVDDHWGWALLPEECWTAKLPVYVRVFADERISDRAAFAALTVDTARAVAAGAGCGDLPGKPGALVPPPSDAARPATEGKACGLDGFSVRGQVPDGAKVLEESRTAPADIWTCKLTLDDEPRAFERAEGFMTYTASRDPLLIAAVRKSPGVSGGTGPDGRKADVVSVSEMILPCAEGEPLYVSLQPHRQYLKARETAGLPQPAAYAAPFVAAAVDAFDCPAP
ncbi:hypothetical protein [Streptomyces californicus]|uniref:hypothetical protein n=1 Tax=Streptomyces californicus TaxID=67351 RepID=UPI00379F6D81